MAIEKECSKEGCDRPRWSTACKCRIHHLEVANNARRGYETEFKAGLYKIVDTYDNDRIVYIGEGSNLPTRYYGHLGGVKNNTKQFLNRPATLAERKQYKFVSWIEENSKIKRGILEKEPNQTHPTPVSYTHLTLPTKA